MEYDSQEKEYIYLIGQGLSVFGTMEIALAEVFIIALRSEDPKAAQRVFWSVNSLEVRTAMTAAALKSAFCLLPKKSKLPSLWSEIALAIPKLARKRNELAHGNWVFMAWGRSAESFKRDQFFAPFYGRAGVDKPFYSDDPRYDPRPKKRLYLPDLEARLKEFSELQLKIRHVLALLSAELREAPLRTEEQVHRASRQARPSATRTK